MTVFRSFVTNQIAFIHTTCYYFLTFYCASLFDLYALFVRFANSKSYQIKYSNSFNTTDLTNMTTVISSEIKKLRIGILEYFYYKKEKIYYQPF